jgi:hypothetical protein
MIRILPHLLVLAAGLAACSGGEQPQTRQPLPTDTGDATVFTLDTADFLLIDTGSTFETTDSIPLHELYISQSGTWSLSPAGGPFTDIVGDMIVREYIDELVKKPKTKGGEPQYDCEALYTLTGQSPDEHSCQSCDFVFDIEFFVNEGDATACREPDTPQHQVVWRMGYDSGQEKILYNYGGTGVWVPWMDAQLSGNDLTFSFQTQVAIQVDEETTQ